MKNSDILQRFSFALLLFAAVLVAGQTPASESRRVYFFGNSLIHHLSDTDETTVPHWLNRIARADGRGFFTDGQWGFLRQFSGDYPPVPNWSFREIRGVWNPDVRSFGRAGLMQSSLIRRISFRVKTPIRTMLLTQNRAAALCQQRLISWKKSVRTG